MVVAISQSNDIAENLIGKILALQYFRRDLLAST